MTQRRHESPDVGAMVLRMLRSLVERAAEGDLEAIEQLAMIEARAGKAVGAAMMRAHDGAGYSWTELAGAVGTTRQAARARGLAADLAPFRRG